MISIAQFMQTLQIYVLPAVPIAGFPSAIFKFVQLRLGELMYRYDANPAVHADFLDIQTLQFIQIVEFMRIFQFL